MPKITITSFLSLLICMPRIINLKLAPSLLMIFVAATAANCETPAQVLGTWSSSDSSCDPNADPSEATIYTITRNYISFYEIECHVQDVISDAVETRLNLDCFKGGGFRYFQKMRIAKLSPNKLKLKFDQYTEIVRRCEQAGITTPPDLLVKRSKWSHNGSVVSFVESNGGLEIDYQTPRAGLAPVGVREGTMLFYGSKESNVIDGKAYMFNQRCGPLEYHVHGEVIDGGSTVVLTGLSPRVDTKCEVVSSKGDILRFSKIQ